MVWLFGLHLAVSAACAIYFVILFMLPHASPLRMWVIRRVERKE